MKLNERERVTGTLCMSLYFILLLENQLWLNAIDITPNRESDRNPDESGAELNASNREPHRNSDQSAVEPNASNREPHRNSDQSAVEPNARNKCNLHRRAVLQKLCLDITDYTLNLPKVAKLYGCNIDIFYHSKWGHLARETVSPPVYYNDPHADCTPLRQVGPEKGIRLGLYNDEGNVRFCQMEDNEQEQNTDGTVTEEEEEEGRLLQTV